MESQVAKLESRIEGLLSQQETLRGALSEAKDYHKEAKEQMKEQINDLREQKDDMKRQRDELKEENKSLKSELALLRSRLNAMEKPSSVPQKCQDVQNDKERSSPGTVSPQVTASVLRTSVHHFPDAGEIASSLPWRYGHGNQLPEQAMQQKEELAQDDRQPEKAVAAATVAQEQQEGSSCEVASAPVDDDQDEIPPEAIPADPVVAPAQQPSQADPGPVKKESVPSPTVEGTAEVTQVKEAKRKPVSQVAAKPEKGKLPVPHDALALALAFRFRTKEDFHRANELAMSGPGTWRNAVISSPEMWADGGLLGSQHWELIQLRNGTMKLPEILILSSRHDPDRWLRLDAKLQADDRRLLLNTLRELQVTHLDWVLVSHNLFPGHQPTWHTYIPGQSSGIEMPPMPTPGAVDKSDVNLPLLKGLKVAPHVVKEFLQCKELEDLNIIETDNYFNFDDFSHLSTFSKLTRLEISGVRMQSLTVVEAFTSLRTLTLRDVSVQPGSHPSATVPPLKLPSSLEELRCESIDLCFPPPKRGTECRFLRTVYFEVDNIAIVEKWLPLWTKVTALEVMTCYPDMTFDLTRSLLSLKELRDLTLRGAVPENLEVVSQHPSIERLELCGMDRNGLSPTQLARFKRSPSLKSLKLFGDPATVRQLRQAVRDLKRTLSVEIIDNSKMGLGDLLGLNHAGLLGLNHDETSSDDEPPAAVPVAATVRCLMCNKSEIEVGKQLLKCSRCKVARYCGAACQKAHWKTHKGLCKSA